MRTKKVVGACGGTQIWNKNPLRHWCRATIQEVAMGALSGARLLDYWDGHPGHTWEPLQLFMRIHNTRDDGQPNFYPIPKGKGEWAVIRLNKDCPMRQPRLRVRPKSSVSTRARVRTRASAGS